jgi:hypothetical protein
MLRSALEWRRPSQRYANSRVPSTVPVLREQQRLGA